MMMKLQLPDCWGCVLSDTLASASFGHLMSFLGDEISHGSTILPAPSDVFRAFSMTSWDCVRVVILGQDPYHDIGQADGLAFSVKEGISLPPSLRNIYREMMDDLGCDMPVNGDLSVWAKQGVLLLNTTLTVEAHKPLSHHDKGREYFTDAVIERISEHKEGVIFLLRGKYAQSKRPLIDENAHYVLTAPHPSPLSAWRGWFGSRHFSGVNELLIQSGQEPIQRQIDVQ